MLNPSPSQWIHLCQAFSLFWKQMKIAGGYVISLKLEEKAVKTPLIHRKKFWKTTQKSHWNVACQDDWLSNSSYLCPYGVFFKKLILARTDAPWINNHGWLNEGYLILLWSDSGTFFGRPLYYVTMLSLIVWFKWIQSTPVLDHCPALNSCSSRA